MTDTNRTIKAAEIRETDDGYEAGGAAFADNGHGDTVSDALRDLADNIEEEPFGNSIQN